MMVNLDSAAVDRADLWLNSAIEEADKAAIRRMKEDDAAAFNEAFYTDLEFGTGGLRGLMRLGSNGMNRYTVGLTTQCSALRRLEVCSGVVTARGSLTRAL